MTSVPELLAWCALAVLVGYRIREFMHARMVRKIADEYDRMIKRSREREDELHRLLVAVVDKHRGIWRVLHEAHVRGLHHETHSDAEEIAHRLGWNFQSEYGGLQEPQGEKS